MEKVFNSVVAAELRRAGFLQTAIYVQHCSDMWELMNYRTLVRQEDLSQFYKKLDPILEHFERWDKDRFTADYPRHPSAAEIPPVTTLNDCRTTINGFILISKAKSHNLNNSFRLETINWTSEE